jgi:hypothetical protein
MLMTTNLRQKPEFAVNNLSFQCFSAENIHKYFFNFPESIVFFHFNNKIQPHEPVQYYCPKSVSGDFIVLHLCHVALLSLTHPLHVTSTGHLLLDGQIGGLDVGRKNFVLQHGLETNFVTHTAL